MSSYLGFMVWWPSSLCGVGLGSSISSEEIQSLIPYLIGMIIVIGIDNFQTFGEIVGIM